MEIHLLTAAFDEFFDRLVEAIELHPPSEYLKTTFPRDDIAEVVEFSKGILWASPSRALIAWARALRAEREHGPVVA